MRKSFGKIAIGTATLTLAMLLSLDWSGQGSMSFSVEGAQARVGRPLTPVSVAGVARRQYRRSTYGYGYGAGAVAAGVVGAATVAAATAPWGYQAYGHPYNEGDHYAYASEDPGYAGGYYAESPWGYYDCRLPHTYDCQPYAHVGWYHY